MTEGVLALVVASGLVVSLIGGWKAMRSTPVLGGDGDGYLTGDLPGIVEARKNYRDAWKLLLSGFFLQFLGTVGFAVLAFTRA